MWCSKIAKSLLVGSALLCSAAASAETLIVTTNLPPAHWASTKGGEPWMACVKQATNNEIDFKYFPSGQLASFFESLKAVNDGLAQVSYIVLSAQTDKMPLNGLVLLPEMGESVVEITKAYRKVLDSDGLLAKEFAKNRIKPLLINAFPPYQMLSRAEPMDTIEKLSTKKISTGGGTLIITLKSLGSSAIEMSSGDLYLALQQGTVDGTMLSLTSVKPYNLQEVVKSMSGNANFGVAVGVWSIDAALWKKMSPAHQKAMTDCGNKVETDMAAYADQLQTDLKTEFVKSGITIFNYTSEAMAAIDKRLKKSKDDYIARIASRGLPAQEAYKEYTGALGQ